MCTLQQMAGCQVATGDGSISASPAEPPGTSYPCLGGRGGFNKALGYSHILSPGRVPKGALGHGKETGPVMMLVPAQGALQPVGGRLSITVITSSWLQVHGALSWDSFQRPGSGGQGTAILGSPRHPSCHALCCPRRRGHAFHEGPSTLLPPMHRGEPHSKDEAAQCRAEVGQAGPIQMALCLPDRCHQGRGRNNSLWT